MRYFLIHVDEVRGGRTFAFSVALVTLTAAPPYSYTHPFWLAKHTRRLPRHDGIDGTDDSRMLGYSDGDTSVESR
jgi:hypothetical protein